METGFENEAYERAKVYKELVRLDDEVASMKQSGSCAVSSAASTGHGLGSGTFTRPPPLGRNWKENWMPRKMEVTSWVKNWMPREMTRLFDEQMLKLLTEMEDILPKE